MLRVTGAGITGGGGDCLICDFLAGVLDQGCDGLRLGGFRGLTGAPGRYRRGQNFDSVAVLAPHECL